MWTKCHNNVINLNNKEVYIHRISVSRPPRWWVPQKKCFKITDTVCRCHCVCVSCAALTCFQHLGMKLRHLWEQRFQDEPEDRKRWIGNERKHWLGWYIYILYIKCKLIQCQLINQGVCICFSCMYLQGSISAERWNTLHNTTHLICNRLNNLRQNPRHQILRDRKDLRENEKNKRFAINVSGIWNVSHFTQAF